MSAKSPKPHTRHDPAFEGSQDYGSNSVRNRRRGSAESNRIARKPFSCGRDKDMPQLSSPVMTVITDLPKLTQSEIHQDLVRHCHTIVMTLLKQLHLENEAQQLEQTMQTRREDYEKSKSTYAQFPSLPELHSKYRERDEARANRIKNHHSQNADVLHREIEKVVSMLVEFLQNTCAARDEAARKEELSIAQREITCRLDRQEKLLSSLLGRGPPEVVDEKDDLGAVTRDFASRINRNEESLNVLLERGRLVNKDELGVVEQDLRSSINHHEKSLHSLLARGRLVSEEELGVMRRGLERHMDCQEKTFNQVMEQERAASQGRFADMQSNIQAQLIQLQNTVKSMVRQEREAQLAELDHARNTMDDQIRQATKFRDEMADLTALMVEHSLAIEKLESQHSQPEKAVIDQSQQVLEECKQLSGFESQIADLKVDMHGLARRLDDMKAKADEQASVNRQINGMLHEHARQLGDLDTECLDRTADFIAIDFPTWKSTTQDQAAALTKLDRLTPHIERLVYLPDKLTLFQKAQDAVVDQMTHQVDKLRMAQVDMQDRWKEEWEQVKSVVAAVRESLARPAAPLSAPSPSHSCLTPDSGLTLLRQALDDQMKKLDEDLTGLKQFTEQELEAIRGDASRRFETIDLTMSNVDSRLSNMTRAVADHVITYLGRAYPKLNMTAGMAADVQALKTQLDSLTDALKMHERDIETMLSAFLPQAIPPSHATGGASLRPELHQFILDNLPRLRSLVNSFGGASAGGANGGDSGDTAAAPTFGDPTYDGAPFTSNPPPAPPLAPPHTNPSNPPTAPLHTTPALALAPPPAAIGLAQSPPVAGLASAFGLNPGDGGQPAGMPTAGPIPPPATPIMSSVVPLSTLSIPSVTNLPRTHPGSAASLHIGNASALPHPPPGTGVHEGASPVSSTLTTPTLGPGAFIAGQGVVGTTPAFLGAGNYVRPSTVASAPPLVRGKNNYPAVTNHGPHPTFKYDPSGNIT